MNHIVEKIFAAIAGAIMLSAAGVAVAAGASTERERTMQRYQHCTWTDQMSRYVYECVRDNNGFNTHWCFDETVQLHCEPAPVQAAAPAAVQAQVAQAASSEEERMRASRRGEENLRGTMERENTMLKYKDCAWTDEMGKFVYECVKRNNGFGVHWCHDEAKQTMCPQPEEVKG
jgi:hypothetical protein